jgi:hypothetical protein
MLRNILGVIAGLLTWGVSVTLCNRLMRFGWPAYALAEPSLHFSLAMLLARLVMSLVASVAAGWLAARVANRNGKAAWSLGLLLLLLFLPVHYSLWDKFPAWYHLVFLLTLAPLIGFGGSLAQGNDG